MSSVAMAAAAATNTSTNRNPRSSSVPCSSKISALESEAAAAALRVSRPDQQPRTDLGGLQITRGAASHYPRVAEARTVPKYPIARLSNPESAGAAAASLAHSSAESPAVWKPDIISAAGAAASLAHSAKSKPDIWKAAAEPSAGKAALCALGGAATPSYSHETAKETTSWPLSGAIGAIHSRSHSASIHTAAASAGLLASTEGSHALSAATLVHNHLAKRAEGGPTKSAGKDLANASSALAMSQRRSDVLRAATISMANTPGDKHNSSDQSSDTGSKRQSTPVYSHLEESARAMAQRRLALIGYSPDVLPSAPSELLRGRRGRSMSLVSEYSDKYRAGHIDAEMNQLKVDLAKADKLKRGRDAVTLMTAAKKKVDAQMSGLDREVAQSRGYVPREDKELVAILMAKRDTETHDENSGKIDIGGGAYISQDDIEAIAQRNVKPVLDELERRAEEDRHAKEVERARVEEGRLERENEKRVQRFRAAQEKNTERATEEAAGMPPLRRLASTRANIEEEERESSRQSPRAFDIRENDTHQPTGIVVSLPEEAAAAKRGILSKLRPKRHSVAALDAEDKPRNSGGPRGAADQEPLTGRESRGGFHLLEKFRRSKAGPDEEPAHHTVVTSRAAATPIPAEFAIGDVSPVSLPSNLAAATESPVSPVSPVSSHPGMDNDSLAELAVAGSPLVATQNTAITSTGPASAESVDNHVPQSQPMRKALSKSSTESRFHEAF